MADHFPEAFDELIGLEGGYVNDAADTGGETRYGVTKRVARANGYEGDMRELPLDEARRIARKQYWDSLRLDSIAELSSDIAGELFDTGYNMGTGTAGKFLQRALNVLNRRGHLYSDLTVDGLVGPVTVAALRSFLDYRDDHGESVMMSALNALQAVRYIEIAENNPKQERFVYGWLLNRVD